MSAAADRGLKAVRRVREARERDSRLGLQQALSETRRLEVEAAASRVRFESTPRFGDGTALEYRAYTRLVRALAESVVEKEEAVRRTTAVADEARRRWGLDVQAVRTVELLLERRADERRADRARREAAELDDLAAQGWLRARAAKPTPREVSA
ncbi:MAG TPA: flagellar FliJ family protein [Nocardioidaceae bacterium]|nr:flagellar FliJ family protein [Nocardioidaceae bacterium]